MLCYLFHMNIPGVCWKPHSYYVENIKGCAATRAEVESVGGLWHAPDFSPSAHLKTCRHCICLRVSVACACLCGLEKEAMLGLMSLFGIITPSAKYLYREILSKAIDNMYYQSRQCVWFLHWWRTCYEMLCDKQRLGITELIKLCNSGLCICLLQND